MRSLGGHLHFRVPLWRDLLARFGTVDGRPENCEALMRAGESIVVFPGGAREVFKHKGAPLRTLMATSGHECALRRRPSTRPHDCAAMAPLGAHGLLLRERS